MWESFVPGRQDAPTVTLILVGNEPIAQFSALKSTETDFQQLRNDSFLSFHRYVDRSEAGETKLILEIFRATELRHELAEVIKFKGDAVLVTSFSWLRPDLWPNQVSVLNQITSSYTSRGDDSSEKTHVKVLIMCHDYEEVMHDNSSASLSTDADACHQYLRATALKLSASTLAYPNSALPAFFWLASLKHALNLDKDISYPSESWVGEPIIVLGGDDKQKILAINPHFDVDAAFENIMGLKPIIPPLFSDDSEHIALPKILRELIVEHERQNAQSPNSAGSQSRFDAKQFRMLLAQGGDNEEHRVMSDFFTTLAEKSMYSEAKQPEGLK